MLKIYSFFWAVPRHRLRVLFLTLVLGLTVLLLASCQQPSSTRLFNSSATLLSQKCIGGANSLFGPNGKFD